jgi:hypothetical protein
LVRGEFTANSSRVKRVAAPLPVVDVVEAEEVRGSISAGGGVILRPQS